MTAQKAIVIHPALRRKEAIVLRDAHGRLEEAVGLARAIDLDVAARLVAPVTQQRPATLFGTGKVEEIKLLIEDHEAALVIIDAALTPVQQRNLERAWACKVIDRTALILEIFGARARTREGKLQVELAALTYQKSRLVRSWTHLERQRGGFGFLGGPGESQIEIDRRLIRDRIAKLKRELETVVRTRQLQRTVRREAPYPVAALVGYTNAGKSTLFNLLTGAQVTAENALFATLDPTIRAVALPSGLGIMLSDTVGFVSDLPTALVAAFRATLEEVLEADILIHVRDIAHPDSDAQKQDVLNVLSELFDGEELTGRIIEVWNKADLLPPDMARNMEEHATAIDAGPLLLSALTGAGVDALRHRLDTRLSEKFHVTREYRLPLHEGKLTAWLHAHGCVMSSAVNEEYQHVTVQLTPKDAARFEKMQAGAA